MLVLVFVLAEAAVTKCHRLGGLDKRSVFSHSSGGWNSEIGGPAQSGSAEGPLPGLVGGTVSLCPHMAGREFWSLPLTKTLIPHGGSTLLTSVKPDRLPEGSIPSTGDEDLHRGILGGHKHSQQF